MVGHGDVHRLEQLRTTYSLVEAERDPVSICEAIAAGRVRVFSRSLPWSTAAGITATLIAPSRGWPVGSTEPARASM